MLPYLGQWRVDIKVKRVFKVVVGKLAKVGFVPAAQRSS
jgi:hypothetical protein